MTKFLWLTLVLIMVMGLKGEKEEMTYWELILPRTATGLTLVCPFPSRTVFFCSSVPLPIFLLLLHIPLFIQSPHSLCPFLIRLSIFYSHILLWLISILIPHLCALTSAQPHAGPSSLRLPSTLSSPIYSSFPTTSESWSWPFFPLCSRAFFPLGFLISKEWCIKSFTSTCGTN